MLDLNTERKIRNINEYIVNNITGEDDISKKKKQIILKHIELFDRVDNAFKSHANEKFIYKMVEEFDEYVDNEHYLLAQIENIKPFRRK